MLLRLFYKRTAEKRTIKMPDEKNCNGAYVGLSLTSLALLISVCLNILLYSLRRRDRQNKDLEHSLYQESFHAERFDEDQRLSQENPIYGNICMDGGGPLSVSSYGGYEPMADHRARQDDKDEPADVSYASLDLNVAQKRKKKRKYQQKQSQLYEVQTHAPPTGADGEPALPSRSSSLMVSRNSIYLNSHQVALETEDLDRRRERDRKYNRERDMEMHGGFDHSLDQSEPRHEQDC